MAPHVVRSLSLSLLDARRSPLAPGAPIRGARFRHGARSRARAHTGLFRVASWSSPSICFDEEGGERLVAATPHHTTPLGRSSADKQQWRTDLIRRSRPRHTSACRRRRRRRRRCRNMHAATRKCAPPGSNRERRCMHARMASMLPMHATSWTRARGHRPAGQRQASLHVPITDERPHRSEDWVG